MRLEVDRPGVEAAGHDVLVGGDSGAAAVDLGDLPLGRPVWVCGRVRADPPGISYLLTSSAGEAARAAGQAVSSNLGALFGARRVAGLEYLMGSGLVGDELAAELRRLGYDPDKVLAVSVGRKVYAENSRKDAVDALKALLVEESLRYGLACAETAFVAVRKEKGKVIDGTVAVANALPSGWSEDFAASMPVSMAMPAAAAPPPNMRRMARSSGATMQQFSAPPMMTMGAGLKAFTMASEPSPEARGSQVVVFAGSPVLVAGECALFDTTAPAGAALLPDGGTITELRIAFSAGTPAPAGLDAGLALLIYVDDLSAPRARVRLADLVRQGLKRPLNILRKPGQVVRIVLSDPDGAWAGGGPAIEVTLALS
jgi:Ca-activated chloride channel family protein